MKGLFNTALILFIVLVSTAFAYAQNDIILKIDGTEMIGNISEIGADDIKFTYKDENIPYVVSKKDVLKVTFSSGRIEFFTKPSTDSATNKLEVHHNKVAILPFSYVKDQGDGGKVMAKKIQQETYAIFNKNKGNLQFQDPSTTNAFLIKAGITGENEEGYTMGEICDILQVEYVVQGIVSIEKTGQSAYSGSSTTVKGSSTTETKKSSTGLIGGLLSSGKATSTSGTIATTTDDFSTSITMNIYNDKGDNIYNRDHSSFWGTEDAYKTTLNFLAKRTPLYSK